MGKLAELYTPSQVLRCSVNRSSHLPPSMFDLFQVLILLKRHTEVKGENVPKVRHKFCSVATLCSARGQTSKL